MRTPGITIGPLALVVGLSLASCSVPATGSTPLGGSPAAASGAPASTMATAPASTGAAPSAPGLAEAQEAMNGIVAGWTRANQRQWDPGVWDAVDAYPNRLTDTRALSNAARLKERGTYEPAGESAPFTVMRVYAYSNHDGTEALVLGGYYTNPQGEPVPDGDQVCLLTRTAGGAWKFTGFVPGSAFPGKAPGDQGPLVSFTPLTPLPGVDLDATGKQAAALRAVATAASTGRAKGVVAQSGNVRAGSAAWGGSYEVVTASRCTVPQGPAIATFEVKNNSLSLIQLDCQVTLKAKPNSRLYWDDPVSGRVSGTRFSLRILYEALVKQRGNGYVVLAHNDHWISNPTRG